MEKEMMERIGEKNYDIATSWKILNKMSKY